MIRLWSTRQCCIVEPVLLMGRYSLLSLQWNLEFVPNHSVRLTSKIPLIRVPLIKVPLIEIAFVKGPLMECFLVKSLLTIGVYVKRL